MKQSLTALFCFGILLWKPQDLQACGTNPSNLVWNDVISQNIYFVHAVKQFPKNGHEIYFRFDPKDPISLPDRPTLHFSWNQLVTPHAKGNWECDPYALVEPAREFIGELYSARPEDSFMPGEHLYGSDSWAVVTSADYKKLRVENPKFAGKWYTYKRNPHLKSPEYLNDPSASKPCGGDQDLPKTPQIDTLREAIDAVLARERKRNIPIWHAVGKCGNPGPCFFQGPLDFGKEECQIPVDSDMPWVRKATHSGEIYFEDHAASPLDFVETYKKDFAKCIRPGGLALMVCKKFNLSNSMYVSADAIVGSPWHQAINVYDSLVKFAKVARLNATTRTYITTLAQNYLNLLRLVEITFEYAERNSGNIPLQDNDSRKEYLGKLAAGIGQRDVELGSLLGEYMIEFEDAALQKALSAYADYKEKMNLITF